MSNTKVVMSQASNQYVAPTYIEDVFSTYLYTGNGSTQTITNGIDLAGEGGLVWTKNRNTTNRHNLIDTDRGIASRLFSDGTDAAATGTWFSSFNTDGYSIGTSNTHLNGGTLTYASWTFRKAPRFFDVVTYTGNGSNQQIAHNLGVEPGCIIVKNTSSVANWCVYHRGTSASAFNQRMQLNTTDAVATSGTAWNGTAPTDTEFSVGNFFNTNASGNTYVAYLYAHDPLGPSGDGSDGLIACGSYTGNGSTNGPEINLGWEPQWLLVKATSGVSAGDCYWLLVDNMRGLNYDAQEKYLAPNVSEAENTIGGGFDPTPTGFKLSGSSIFLNGPSYNYIYIAIRRGPMRVPESGTEVFSLNTYSGTGAAQTITTTIDAPDAALSQVRNTSGWSSPIFYDRMRGKAGLFTDQAAAELASDAYGASVLSNAQKQEIVGNFGSSSGKTYVTWSFKRAPNFFDVVAYTGNGAYGQQPHNLGVAPQLMISKGRQETSYGWSVVHTLSSSNNAGKLNSSDPFGSTYSNLSNFTSTHFPEILDWGSGQGHIAYLFATLAGVSKVGSYTGNGSSQTINCGFTTGARFILIKRTDSTGDWYVWDTARGIVTGNDPHLSLNTTAAEVTSDDSIDPASSGFSVNQVAATNINVSSASYIFYAIA